MKGLIKFFLLFFIPILFVSCFSGKGSYGMPAAEAEMDMAYYEEEPSAGMISQSKAELSSNDRLYEDSQSMLNNLSQLKNDQQGTEKTQQVRLRIYNGEAHLIVEDPQETRRQIEDRLEDWGGYLESSYEDVLVIRIPAELFHESFAEILTYGKVVDERIETWDVTEQYQDLQGRLTVAEQTRDRLYQLLERSTDPEERSNILREIGRLTEEIEQINLNMQSLSNRAALSGITIRLQPRLTQIEDSRRAIPFPWIANLNPMYPVSNEFKGSLELDPGPSFAVFSDASIYRAENPQGVILRMSTLENEPQGDSAFWQKALEFHLSDYYAETVPLELSVGESTLMGVNFLSKDREPYRYTLAVLADGKNLQLLEIFQPDPNWDSSELLNALSEGRLK